MFYSSLLQVEMVTISRNRSGTGHRKQTAVVYLLIGAIVLFSFNALSVPNDNELQNNLRGDLQIPKREVIEFDIDNPILTAVETNDEQLTTTTAALDINKIDVEEIDTVAPTGSPTTFASTTTTATTTASIPIRDMILKRSLEVKQLILDQFSGSSNSPPNPRYHQTLHTPKMTPKSTSCDQEDAFNGIPIDDGKHHAWVPNPPGGYSREAITKWEDAFNGAMKRIREETAGGDKLREFAEKEVKQLRRLRHSLFCKRE